jgi:outer membrane lipoprotein-sorting protein
MKKTTQYLFIVFLLGSVLLPSVCANTVVEKGLIIAKEISLRNRGWNDTLAELNMVLTDKKGRISERALKVKTLEVKNDGDKSLIVFNSPKDINGTAFLSFSHSLKPDHQWLYLPALKRIKRISSSNKSGPFLGSELAFEDISSFEVEKYSYEYLKDETIEGAKVFVVKYIPQYPHSGYLYQEAWIDQDKYRVVKMVYYDRKGVLLKTLHFKNFRRYINQYWRANELYAYNHQTGRSTTLNWTNYQFNMGLSDGDFNKNSLKRAR